MSHFLLWRIISTKKLSAVGKSWLRKTLTGMSSRKYNNKSLPVLLRSNLKGEWKQHSIKNRTCRKLSSNLISKPFICSHRRLDLFLTELKFGCPNINLLILLTQIFFLKCSQSVLTVLYEILPLNIMDFSILDLIASSIKFPASSGLYS